MGLPFDREFERIKSIDWILLEDRKGAEPRQSIMDFLNWAQIELREVEDGNRKKHKTINFRGPYERSLLAYAAMGNCTELTNYLLECGALVDDCDQNGLTPLTWAALCGALDTVKILVNNGADVNHTCDEGGTPLTWLRDAGSDDQAARDTETYLEQMGGIGNIMVESPQQ